MHPPAAEPITVPAEPVPGAGSPFPVVASIAPVVASVVIFSFSRSPFVLAFAALGPIIAIAGVVDSRFSSRRRLRSETAKYRVELERLATVVEDRLDAERRYRRAGTGVRAILDGTDAAGPGFGRWRMPAERRTLVVAGYGDSPSGIRVDGPQGEDRAALRRAASVVRDVPIVVDAADGIGVVGPGILVRALARGLLLQLCDAASPEMLSVAELPDDWHWAFGLPHRRETGGATAVRVTELTAGSAPLVPAPEDVLLALADRRDRIPPRCANLIEVTGVASAVLYRAGGSGRTDTTLLTVDLVSEAEARSFAQELVAHARHAGVDTAGDSLPTRVALADIAAPAPGPAGSSLSAVIGSTGDGVVIVDIVEDGPHAIVGGTTGSGKSELLVTWMTSLAERHPPSAVNLLLVDFKGGAAFAPLLPLPHVAGVVTDLDAVSAARALESLRAEIRFRERQLLNAGARSITALPSLARLVIVVDEFAAMLDGYPDLHALFVDIAARGRSLGMHLILCTQRPAGVMRDALLANCGLRMSLRVHNRSDSSAVLGSDAAAFLPPTVPGRLALAAPAGTLLLQVASTSAGDLDRAAGRWPGGPGIRRPWLDPLPPVVDRASLADGPDGIRLGLADHPGEQAQDTAVWRPDVDGSLLVVGAARTGKTTLLDTVEAEVLRTGDRVTERIGSDPELAWDVTHSLAASLVHRSGDERAVLLLLDGFDSLLAGIDVDDAADLRDTVLSLLRDGPRHAVHLVVTVQRLAGPVGVLGGFVGSTLLLGTANRQEHLLAGGEAATWLETRRPGSATWRGTAVQLCAPERRRAGGARHAASRTVTPIDWAAEPITIVVSGTPTRRVDEIRAENARHRSGPPVLVAALGETAGGRITLEQVRAQAGRPVVIVGDGDHWQAHWPLLTALRENARIVVDGCSPAEFRAFTRVRTRPPLLDRVQGRAWCCSPGREVSRVSLETDRFSGRTADGSDQASVARSV